MVARVEQPQHLDELPRAFVTEVCLEAPAQRQEAFGHLDALERTGEVERAGSALQQGQVVAEVEEHALFVP